MRRPLLAPGADENDEDADFEDDDDLLYQMGYKKVTMDEFQNDLYLMWLFGFCRICIEAYLA